MVEVGANGPASLKRWHSLGAGGRAFAVDAIGGHISVGDEQGLLGLVDAGSEVVVAGGVQGLEGGDDTGGLAERTMREGEREERRRGGLGSTPRDEEGSWLCGARKDGTGLFESRCTHRWTVGELMQARHLVRAAPAGRAVHWEQAAW